MEVKRQITLPATGAELLAMLVESYNIRDGAGFSWLRVRLKPSIWPCRPKPFSPAMDWSLRGREVRERTQQQAYQETVEPACCLP